MAGWFVNTSDERLAAYAALAAATVALSIPLVRAWKSWIYRPVINIDFENRARWRRASKIEKTGENGLFFRVRVWNSGWTTAHGLRGRMSEIFDACGERVEPFDPVDLHWAGTRRGVRAGQLDLIPGQEEYLDVFWVVSKGDIIGSSDDGFEVYVQDSTPRGIQLRYPIEGQTLRVVVAGSNTAGNGFELQLPRKGLFATRFLSVKHRPIHYFGQGLFPWDELPPPKNRLDGEIHGGGDAGFGSDGAPHRLK